MKHTIESLRECFPGHGDELESAIHTVSCLRIYDSLSDDDIEMLIAIGKDRPGIQRITGTLSSDVAIAMEYLGPITRMMPFDPRLYDFTLSGNGLDVFIVTDGNGDPIGLIPLDEHIDRFSAFTSMKDSGCTIVTDTIPYSDENILALERSGCDYILRQRQFPISYGPSSQQKMLPLKHNGREYSACKCRYDKRWLFMFLDKEEVDPVRKSVKSMNMRAQDSDYMMKSAGYENAISNVGHDIREVRELIDARIRIDRLMESCRMLLSSDDRLLRNRDAALGFITAFILAGRPEFRQRRCDERHIQDAPS